MADDGRPDPHLSRRAFLRGASAGLAAGSLTLAGGCKYGTQLFLISEPPKADSQRPAWAGSRVQRYRPLGRTGFQMSDISFGCSGLDDAAVARRGVERGITYFDTSPDYSRAGSEIALGTGIHGTPRDRLFVVSKFCTPDGHLATDTPVPAVIESVEASLRRLGTDHLDIVLMHCLTEGDWTTRYEPVMDVLSEAKQKGVIRAHGCSCHSIEALRAAAKSPWVDVDLARVNPVGAHMDAEPDTVISVLREMKASGKGVIGMKILGQGALRDRQDEALRFALGLGVLDAFTIGAESIAEQNDLTKRIAAA